ncbi:MAG: transcriptional repressor NrdR [Clostridia bacterium]|nr:transcriptional repressor NrdR [Clostridia bacterium]MBR5746738.1 transcriptional repressor NrdR [Clostridia bacterium]
MKCPSCGQIESKVIDSRPSADGKSIRRRRECLECGKRFTTYETIEMLPLIVIKKDLSRETFDRNKILNSVIRACDKRRVSLSEMNQLVDEVEAVLQNSLVNEIPSNQIGEMVMERLKKLDEVAYVRFASVYRRFSDIGDFMDELKKLMHEK